MNGITTEERRGGTIVITVAPWGSVTWTRTLRRDGVTAPASKWKTGGVGRMERIMATVCEAYRLSEAQLFGASRTMPLPEARAAVAWALRHGRVTPSFAGIAAFLKRGDHGTARQMVRKAEQLRRSDERFLDLTNALRGY